MCAPEAGPPESVAMSSETDTRPKSVDAVFAPVRRTCSVCGFEAETNQRSCPNCGAWYATVRQRRSWKPIAVVAVVLAAAIVTGALLAKPGIEESKERRAEREATELAERQAQRRARARVEQAPHSARLGSGDPLAALAAAVRADAVARVGDGSLRGPVSDTQCEPYPATEARRRLELREPRGRRGYLCNVTTARIAATERNPEGRLVYPFMAVVDHDAKRLTWCKANPPPGEKAIPELSASVPLSPRCLAG